MYEYVEGRLGILDTISNYMYIMDGFGNLVLVSYTLHNGYFQEH